MMKNIGLWFKSSVGIPRILLALFLMGLFVIGYSVGISPVTSFSDIITRFGMNGILVLSMVPMIQSGCGLNFGMPLAMIAGIFGAVISLELEMTGFTGIIVAILIAILFAIVIGYLYSLIINRVKGDEMIIATYVGFAFIYIMNIFWVSFPFRNPASVQGYTGEGLRTTIGLERYWKSAFSDLLSFRIGDLYVPTGMLLFFFFICVLVWFFFKTKTGTAITAVGSNPEYARASGISINKMRTISVIMSTVIAAVGLIVYQQNFGYIQTYTAPLAFTFPTVAAILLGGASVNKANMTQVILGTFLFQGILTLTPTVITAALKVDASDMFRLIITNGMILYALTRKAD